MTTPRVILLGCGNRGRIYANWIRRNKTRLELVAVADPNDAARNLIADQHDIPAHRRYRDWTLAMGDEPEVDGIIIALQDQLHRDAALAALSTDAHVLLEKPLATTSAATLEIARAAEASESRGGSLSVCHVLRYSSLFRSVKRAVSDGAIGKINTIFMAENIAYYHFAHAYVRGNWRRTDTSSPLILAKSCHDLDIICWLAEAEPAYVASFANQSFFVRENAPVGAPQRCTDGCPVSDSCPYEAVATYLRGTPVKKALARGNGVVPAAARFAVRHPRLAARTPGLSRYSVWTEWPTATITRDLTEQGIRRALETGPYGKCVFRSDNDQPDHQETILSFPNGITATFRLHGRSHEGGRTLRIDGSEGTIRATFAAKTELEIHRHGDNRVTRLPVTGSIVGHAEADDGLMEAWSEVFTGRRLPTDARSSIASHLAAFAAAEAAAQKRAGTLRWD
jgi:predicted dehydrogenase